MKSANFNNAYTKARVTEDRFFKLYADVLILFNNRLAVFQHFNCIRFNRFLLEIRRKM